MQRLPSKLGVRNIYDGFYPYGAVSDRSQTEKHSFT